MKTQITKENLITKVEELKLVIKRTSLQNCYDKAVEFFVITSYLHDNLEEIKTLPLKGWRVFGLKSHQRQIAEQQRKKFLTSIVKAGRNLYGNNRTLRGEIISKDVIYFGNINGMNTLPISTFETKQDPELQMTIRGQVAQFIQSYWLDFEIDWLR